MWVKRINKATQGHCCIENGVPLEFSGSIGMDLEDAHYWCVDNGVLYLLFKSPFALQRCGNMITSMLYAI